MSIVSAKFTGKKAQGSVIDECKLILEKSSAFWCTFSRSSHDSIIIMITIILIEFQRTLERMRNIDASIEQVQSRVTCYSGCSLSYMRSADTHETKGERAARNGRGAEKQTCEAQPTYRARVQAAPRKHRRARLVNPPLAF